MLGAAMNPWEYGYRSNPIQELAYIRLPNQIFDSLTGNYLLVSRY